MRWLTMSFLLALPLSAPAGAETVSESTALVTEILNKNNGEIPYPFERFQDFAGKTEFLNAFIPDGRSLQKNSTDFSDPRIINAMGSRLFIGYSPRAKKIEIISRDKKTTSLISYSLKTTDQD